MSKRICLLATTALVLSVLGSVSRAEEISVPADTKFIIRLDIQTLRGSEIGRELVNLAKKQATVELGGKVLPNTEKIQEMLGFDPLEEIHAVTVSASDYENPENSLVASVKMGKSTGNLEGLILGLPGYQAEDYGQHSIYSATPDDDLRVFGAVHSDAQGDKTILLSVKREAVTNLLDQLDDKSDKKGALKKIRIDADNKPLVNLVFFELPAEILDDGPPANIAKLLRTISVQIGESGANLDVEISLTATTQKQAEQLRQLAQGAIAALDIARSIDLEDEDLKRIQELAHDVKATRDGSIVKVSLSVSASEIWKLIEEEVDK